MGKGEGARQAQGPGTNNGMEWNDHGIWVRWGRWGEEGLGRQAGAGEGARGKAHGRMEKEAGRDYWEEAGMVGKPPPLTHSPTQNSMFRHSLISLSSCWEHASRKSGTQCCRDVEGTPPPPQASTNNVNTRNEKERKCFQGLSLSPPLSAICRKCQVHI